MDFFLFFPPPNLLSCYYWAFSFFFFFSFSSQYKQPSGFSLLDWKTKKIPPHQTQTDDRASSITEALSWWSDSSVVSGLLAQPHLLQLCAVRSPLQRISCSFMFSILLLSEDKSGYHMLSSFIETYKSTLKNLSFEQILLFLYWVLLFLYPFLARLVELIFPVWNIEPLVVTNARCGIFQQVVCIISLEGETFGFDLFCLLTGDVFVSPCCKSRAA